ncbi:MerR family transcriptional regulator [Spiractinospora alimapuensis]|uniref:MerR family transcriptional regulator n=1 Tax=Spiractinospora alimapuensis TaxID=2820884 RepID=UPI001F4076B9|nr:MerR family transcriptional regulator [Spiractinospora alimapuensis]QVQ52788.1 MerR family transcriptional regulator [Spiractinospora alimapuensis]
MGSTELSQIGAAAERSGASPRSLRYYEQQGLLSPGRDANGYRVYDETSIVRARNIKDLLDIGLTVDDLRGPVMDTCLDRPLADTPMCANKLETARRRLAGLDERIERLRRLRERLARYNAELEATAALGAEDPNPAGSPTPA